MPYWLFRSYYFESINTHKKIVIPNGTKSNSISPKFEQVPMIFLIFAKHIFYTQRMKIQSHLTSKDEWRRSEDDGNRE